MTSDLTEDARSVDRSPRREYGSIEDVSGLELVRELGSTVLKHGGGIRAVAVTPDGKRIVSIGDGTSVHVWNTSNGERVFDLEGTDRGLYSLAISPDGKRVFAGGHEAQIFELLTKRRLAVLPVTKPLVVAAAFGPDNSIVFGDDRVPRRFDAKGAPLAPLKGHQGRIEAIAISRDGRRALTCGSDRKIKLQALDTRTPEVLATWPGYAKSCGFSPDATLAWSVGWDHAVVRGATSGKPTFTAKDLAKVRTGTGSADGARLAIATDDAVIVYELPGKQVVARIAFAGADTLAFTPDHQRLVVANDGRGLGEGCGISVFELDSERRVLPADAGHTGSIEALAVAAELPHVLYSLGSDGVIVMWDVETASPMERIGSVAGQGKALASTANGKTLISASDEGELLAWDVARTEGTPFEAEGRSSVAVAISPDGKRIAYAPYMPGQFQVFDLVTRQLVMTCKPHSSQMCAVAFASPDVVISGSADDHAIASSVPSGDRLWTATCAGFVNALCVAGNRVVTGTSEGQLAMWDVVTGAQRGILRAKGPEVMAACCVDEDHVAIVRRSDDYDFSAVELWSLPDRRVVGLVDLAPLRERARSLVASPDKRRLYVGTNSSRVLVFQRS